MTATRPGYPSDQSARRQVPPVASQHDDALDDGPPPEPISPELLAEITREGQIGVLRSIGVQWAVSLAVAAVALLWGGMAAGASALMGAGAYLVPNSLLAMRVLVNSMRPGGGNAATVLVGEFLKMGAAALLLVLVVKLGGTLIVWPALLAGLIAALKSYWVVLAMASIPRKGR